MTSVVAPGASGSNGIWDVAVVGAGPAGLSCAWRLQNAGLRVIVLEATDHPGGAMRTVPTDDGFLLERGPNSVLGSARNLFAVAQALGLQAHIRKAAPTAKSRYVWREGRLRPIPLGLWSFLMGDLLSAGAKLRLLCEPFVGGRRATTTAWATGEARSALTGDEGASASSPDESVYDFFARRLGREAADYVAAPFVSGVYAGDAHALSAREAFPLLAAWEARRGSLVLGALLDGARALPGPTTSVPGSEASPADDPSTRLPPLTGAAMGPGLYSFDGGLGSFTSALAAAVGTLRLGHPVTGLTPFSFDQADGDGGPREARRAWMLSGPGDSGRALPEVQARQVVIAGGPPAVASLLASLPQASLLPDTPKVIGEAVAAAQEIPMASVAVVHMATQRPESYPRGFGFLVPRGTGPRILGCLFPSQLFPDRAPPGQGLLTVFVGGITDPGALDMDDPELFTLAAREVAHIVNTTDPTLRSLAVWRHRRAIPQFTSGHSARVARVRAALMRLPGLHVAGNWLAGVAASAAVDSGLAAAEAVWAYHPERANAPNGRREMTP